MPRIAFDAYMAGVIDSDGSFSMVKRLKQSTIRGYHYSTVFQLTWKKSSFAEKVLKLIKQRYGGHISPWQRKPNKYSKESIECLKYAVESSGLEKLIILTLPYICLKKEQALLIKKVREIRKIKPKTRNKPNKFWEEEDKIYEELKKLHKEI